MCDMVTIVGGSLVAWYRSSSDVGERVWWVVRLRLRKKFKLNKSEVG